MFILFVCRDILNALYLGTVSSRHLEPPLFICEAVKQPQKPVRLSTGGFVPMLIAAGRYLQLEMYILNLLS